MIQDFARFDEQYFWRNGFYDEPEYVTKLAPVITNTIGTNGTILDVGCGRGHLVARLREHGYLAYGIDPSSFAVNTSVCPDFVAQLPFGAELPWDHDWDLVVLWNVAHVIGLRDLVHGTLAMRPCVRNVLIDWGLTPTEDIDTRFPHASLSSDLCRRLGFGPHHGFGREAQNIGWGFCGGQTDNLSTPPERFTSIVITPGGDTAITLASLVSVLDGQENNTGEVVLISEHKTVSPKYLGGWPCRVLSDLAYDELEPADWICRTIGNHVVFLPAGRIATEEMLRPTEGWEVPAAILVRENNVSGHEDALRGIHPSRPRLLIRGDERMLLAPCDKNAETSKWGDREAILRGEPKRLGMEVSIGKIESPGRSPVAKRPTVTGLASLCYDVIDPLFGGDECEGLVACPVGQDISCLSATGKRFRCIDLRFLAPDYVPLVVKAFSERTEVFVSNDESDDARFVRIPLTVPWWNLLPQERRDGPPAVAWLGNDAVAWEFVAAANEWRKYAERGNLIHCLGLQNLSLELPFVARLHPGGLASHLRQIGGEIDVFFIPETEPFHTLGKLVATAMATTFVVCDRGELVVVEQMQKQRQDMVALREKQIETAESFDEYAIWERILT